MRTNRITILVEDIDEALSFYENAFGLKVIEDKQISESKRLAQIGTGNDDISFNLALAKPETRISLVVKQVEGYLSLSTQSI